MESGASDQLQLADGRLLAWTRWGPPDGRPVLFCTGAGTSGSLGFGTDVLPRLGLQLLSIDRPGLGRSSPHPDKTLATWVDDIGELVSRLALVNPMAVGFSQGAVFAAALAGAEVVTAAALVSGQDDLVAQREHLPAEVAALVDATARDPDTVEQEIARTANPDWLWGLVIETSDEVDRQVYLADGFGPHFRQALDEGFAQGPAGYARDLVNALGPWLQPPERIAVPVELWYGALDTSPVHSPDHGRTLARRFPNCHHRLLGSEGGSLLWTRSGQILMALRDR
jgi:pimeloyl-ACP methyl ester carboxylesterase